MRKSAYINIFLLASILGVVVFFLSQVIYFYSVPIDIYISEHLFSEVKYLEVIPRILTLWGLISIFLRLLIVIIITFVFVFLALRFFQVRDSRRLPLISTVVFFVCLVLFNQGYLVIFLDSTVFQLVLSSLISDVLILLFFYIVSCAALKMHGGKH